MGYIDGHGLAPNANRVNVEANSSKQEQTLAVKVRSLSFGFAPLPVFWLWQF